MVLCLTSFKNFESHVSRLVTGQRPRTGSMTITKVRGPQAAWWVSGGAGRVPERTGWALDGAGWASDPVGRALEPAGRASEPAGRALEPAGRALRMMTKDT